MKLIYGIFCSLFITLFLGMGGASAASPLRIAVIDPTSGPVAQVGLMSIKTLEFDAARINADGGIDGHPVKIIVFPNDANPKKTLTQFHAVTNQGINYIVQGVTSSSASALLHAVVQHNQRNPQSPVVYLNWTSQDNAFTNARCSFWFFRYTPDENMMMNALVKWISEQHGIHKVYLMNENYSFGHSFAKTARRLLGEKDPGVKIVGDVFIPFNKVKDFTPYVLQIEASDADVVLTGNYGNDLTLLVKSVASVGLKNVKIISFFANNPGVVGSLGQAAVGRLYVASQLPSYRHHSAIAKQEVSMRKESGYDYASLRDTYLLRTLRLAVEKAHSTQPKAVAFALEGIHVDVGAGPAFIRAADHQLESPLFVSVVSDHAQYPVDGTTDLGWRVVGKFTAAEAALPTTCHMRRPERSR